MVWFERNMPPTVRLSAQLDCTCEHQRFFGSDGFLIAS
jgi:hypothetical protein